MKVLVLGGTGAMGVHLAKILSDNGEGVYVTSRRQRLSENNIRYITGDAKNDDFIQDADNVIGATYDLYPKLSKGGFSKYFRDWIRLIFDFKRKNDSMLFKALFRINSPLIIWLMEKKFIIVSY